LKRLIASFSRAGAVLFCLLAVLVFLTTQPFVSTVNTAPQTVDPVQLERHVRQLSEAFFPRSADQPRQTALAVQYIQDQMIAAGGRVTWQEFSVQEAKYKNIVARFGPEQSFKQQPILVFGAHYDSHGDSAKAALTGQLFTKESHTPGADDNASGVAGLIELAKLLGKTAPQQPIELVAYATEEPPHFRTEHMGSRRHAKSLRDSGHSVKLMVSIEMIGYFSDVPASQHYPVPLMSTLYSDKANFIAVVGRLESFGLIRQVKASMGGASNLPVYSINAPAVIQGIDFSDHWSYWQNGFPAVMVTDTSFMRNPHYHQATDTAEKLDRQKMSQVVQGLYAITLF
jgi:Zn-dependent M28 family amino/carboxypeptidase